MTRFVDLQFDDQTVLAQLNACIASLTDPAPLLADLGEYLAETTKQRFETSTGPDGLPWAPNTELTIEMYLGLFKGSHKKDGTWTKKGAGLAAAKKPLIGESRDLSTQISYFVGQGFVDIGSPMIYAGVQQFGAAQHSFTGGKNPWGDIPARPFLGISSQDEIHVLAILRDYVSASFGGSP